VLLQDADDLLHLLVDFLHFVPWGCTGERRRRRALASKQRTRVSVNVTYQGVYSACWAPRNRNHRRFTLVCCRDRRAAKPSV